MAGDGDAGFAGRAVDAAIKIGLVALLAVWCLEIVRPFMLPLIWGAIIAIASYPGFVRLERGLGGKARLAAILWTIIGLILVLGPIGMLAGVLVDNVQSLAAQLRAEGVHVPAPPDAIATWPFVGEPAHRFWALASTNLGAALAQIETQIRALSAVLLTAIASAGLGMLQFVIAVIIAGVLLPQAEGGARAAHAVATRLAGERGPGLVTLAEATVRSVARGVLGTAMIQALLAGTGLVVAGVPAAGLLAFLCLILCTVQIGPWPRADPVDDLPVLERGDDDRDPVHGVEHPGHAGRQCAQALPDAPQRRRAHGDHPDRRRRRPAGLWPDRRLSGTCDHCAGLRAVPRLGPRRAGGFEPDDGMTADVTRLCRMRERRVAPAT